MDTLIRSIKFPFAFDVEKLQNDVGKILNEKWVDHYNPKDYSGKWTCIALMSQTGKSDYVYAVPNGPGDIKLVATEVLNSCTYFKEILDSFLFEKTAVRLLQLAVGADIKPHSDNCLGYEDGSFRLHIPIITNSEVEFFLDSTRLTMNEGECWYINANFIHSVANRGYKDRIHLVIDGIRNEWTDAMFYKEASENQFIKPVPSISDEQKKLIIAELRRMNTPRANEMIKELEI
ncbi:aspartyl/asparaginyl beta-hydroxylase domain-containing protein [Flavobacterium cerinum]|uniref:Aspartyl/asparaginyl beta-hydroxylase domain-containing protein n=2 Tax=Flavobacterium cerinum TaxID=2502784 RepID=A0A3S3Q987_9FLAO|nr:aspartyl/asparaginyl beta-hydroxylase domain-containing protein [Flavobacterium cerinum]